MFFFYSGWKNESMAIFSGMPIDLCEGNETCQANKRQLYKK